ncbi:uncharacterized protein LOC129793969 [Lutzomyia longipalpis]|uniref:uncharacterized protein LOC129793969 n=1 Tax=Lutzomyia longipalpis TaxID=7200 RepID=UPI002483ECA9|nr:uncharacterized protein LOC129793969 [Lutzomyia longipalpis]
MKVLICLSVFVAATVALHLPAGFQRPPRPLPEDGEVNAVPPHIPEHVSPEIEELMNDIRDFMEALPHKKLRKLVKDAFKNDEQFRQTVTFLQSPKFHKIMKEIESIPEVQELFRPFKEHHEIQGEDLAIRALVALNDEIEIETLPGTVEQHPGGGICGLIDRIIAILPHEKLRALHREKVAKGGVFAEIVSFLTSDRFQQGFHAVIQSERFLELDGVLREHGVCLDKFVELPMNVFGFH